MTTGTEIGAGIGAVAAMGFLVRFLVGKLGKKQDKEMCNTIRTNFEKDLSRGEEKFDVIMTTLTELKVTNEGVRVSNEGIEKELGRLSKEVRIYNGKNGN